MFVLLMASFCGKAGPLGDCTPRCAATCSCLVSSRLRQTWEKAQPLPGVVLGEKNLFTDAESLFLCEGLPAHSVVFPELTVGPSVAVRAPPRRVPRGSASPGSSSWRSVPTGGHGPWDTASLHGASPELSTPLAASTRQHRRLPQHPPLAALHSTTLPLSSHATLLCLSAKADPLLWVPPVPSIG